MGTPLPTLKNCCEEHKVENMPGRRGAEVTYGPLSESPEEMDSGPREECVLALGSIVFWP